MVVGKCSLSNYYTPKHVIYSALLMKVWLGLNENIQMSLPENN